MNKTRRMMIKNICKLYLEPAINSLESVKDDEEFAFENLPEGFQMSEKGETMQENVETLEEAMNILEEAKSLIEEVITMVEDL